MGRKKSFGALLANLSKRIMWQQKDPEDLLGRVDDVASEVDDGMYNPVDLDASDYEDDLLEGVDDSIDEPEDFESDAACWEDSEEE